MLLGQGQLLPGAERLGGIERCHLIENPQYRLPVLSSTFHGRDLFAPSAAHLALGVPLEHIGAEIDPSELQALDWPPVGVAEGALTTAVIYRDTFGNAKLAGLTADLSEALGPLAHGDVLVLRLGDDGSRSEQVIWASTFGDVPAGQRLLYEDSYGRLCIAENQGSATRSLELRDGMPVTIARPALQAAE